MTAKCCIVFATARLAGTELSTARSIANRTWFAIQGEMPTIEIKHYFKMENTDTYAKNPPSE